MKRLPASFHVNMQIACNKAASLQRYKNTAVEFIHLICVRVYGLRLLLHVVMMFMIFVTASISHSV